MRSHSKLSTIAFITVVVFFAGCIMLRFFTRQVLVKRLGMENAFTTAVLFDAQALNNADDATNNARKDIDWTALYPFKSDSISSEDTVPTHLEAVQMYVETYASTVEATKNHIEAYATDFLPFKKDMAKAANTYLRSMQWDYVPLTEYNAVINTTDGYLVTVVRKINVKTQANGTISFARWCEHTGIPFVYIAAPSKICKEEDSDLSGTLDFCNQNADEFLLAIGDSDVRTLNLCEVLHSEGLNHHSLFFRTDHHWLPQTGLWAASKVATLLNEQCGMSVDLTRMTQDSFYSEVYPNWFLGSQGKKVTLQRADPEDIELLYPGYDTRLHYTVRSLEIDVEGDFSILYDMSQIAKKDYYDLDPYAAYTYGNQPLETIRNKQEGLTGHVLVVHDSFGNTVVPFLAMGLQRVDSIDLRSFTGSLRSYITMEKPDAVVILYNPAMLQEHKIFNLL